MFGRQTRHLDTFHAFDREYIDSTTPTHLVQIHLTTIYLNVHETSGRQMNHCSSISTQNALLSNWPSIRTFNKLIFMEFSLHHMQEILNMLLIGGLVTIVYFFGDRKAYRGISISP